MKEFEKFLIRNKKKNLALIKTKLMFGFIVDEDEK